MTMLTVRRALAGFAAGLLCLAPVNAQDVQAGYYLPKSVLVLNSTIESRNVLTPTTAEPRTEPGATTIAVAVTSDPNAYYLLRADEAMLSRTGLTLELAGGTVSSVNRSSEGQLGSIVKGIFGAVVGLAKVAGGVPMSASSDAEQLYRARRPSDAARREALRQALEELQAEKLGVQQQITRAADAKVRDPLTRRLKDLEAGAQIIRRDLAEADLLYAAWKARMEDRQARKVTLVIDVDDLPEDAAVAPLMGKDPSDDELRAAAGRFADAMQQLRIIVTQKGAASPVGAAAPAAGTAHEFLVYRATRPVVLSLYRLTEGNRPVLVQQTVEHVVGPRSAVATLRFKDTKWGKRTLAATFAGGAIATITTETTPGAGAVADTARALPAEYLAALKQANQILAEERTLDLQEVEARITRAAKQKALIEAEVAARSVSDLSAAQSEIARIETEVKLLEARGRAGASADRAATQLEQELLKLHNELIRTQMEQLELQKKIAAMASGGSQ